MVLPHRHHLGLSHQFGGNARRGILDVGSRCIGKVELHLQVFILCLCITHQEEKAIEGCQHMFLHIH